MHLLESFAAAGKIGTPLQFLLKLLQGSFQVGTYIVHGYTVIRVCSLNWHLSSSLSITVILQPFYKAFARCLFKHIPNSYLHVDILLM